MGALVSQHRAEHLDLCAGWALGSLDAADAARLEAHVAAGCAVCDAALREFAEATELLAATAPAAEPPPALRARVLEAARSATAAATTPDGATPPRDRVVPIEGARARRGVPLGWIAAAVAAGLLVWTGTSLVRLRQGVATKDAHIAALERERIDLQERLAESGRWVGVVTAAEARVALLSPTAQGDAALRGRAIVDPGSRRAIVTFTHMHAPEGRAYELWTIRAGQPQSLGVIQSDAAGNAFLQLEVGDVATLQALAVSLEPAGGSPTKNAPSGPVVMLGALGG
jgi:anti-sigma-K factor RskA